ncbi:MAG: hypothetical protein ACRCSF_08200 [Mycobacteriaceae bacterium]
MLTDIDPRVQAELNAKAVLGALPTFVAVVPEAKKLLEILVKPVTLKLRIRGGPSLDLTFYSSRIQNDDSGAVKVALFFTSVSHFNAVMAGNKKPIPCAGVAGLRFLVRVFTPLTELLGDYLRPSSEHLSDHTFVAQQAELALFVTAAALTVVGNKDRGGRFSAASMADGSIDLEVGNRVMHRIIVKDKRLSLSQNFSGPARAALKFRDIDIASGVLNGELGAPACICEGSVALRGFIPMVDSMSRILDRVGQYLGSEKK